MAQYVYCGKEKRESEEGVRLLEGRRTGRWGTGERTEDFWDKAVQRARMHARLIVRRALLKDRPRRSHARGTRVVVRKLDEAWALLDENRHVRFVRRRTRCHLRRTALFGGLL
eukprot:6205927-Pleurochrysis_carterae.AAC.4